MRTAMTAAEPTFIDTNFLIYVGRKRAPRHEIAAKMLRLVEQADSPAWINRR